MYTDKYSFWLENKYFDQGTKNELKAIENDATEIEDRFYKDLEFGTGGLRGILGAGTNRMNIYTVRKAAQGLANFIVINGEEAMKRGVAIAYDSRNMSPEFAMESAKVFTANGIKTYLYDSLRATPQLSFTVRELDTFSGVMVTASHNPKQYNGYKVYGEDGGQLPLESAEVVLKEIEGIEDISTVKFFEESEAFSSGLLEMIGEEVDRKYLDCLKTLSINKEVCVSVGKDMEIVYTPLHGTGNIPVRRILDEVGFKNVIVVPEQELPDGNFSTVRSPNPEERDALNLAINLAKEEHSDIVIGTDPDGDRVGVAVRRPDGEYQILTGNQTGCLLMEYILSQKKERGELPSNGFVVKTIVTTELSRDIASFYGVELVEVLTGFKFIGEQIKLLDDDGDKKFIFGYEESFGYLAGTFVRDKDAIVSSMLIAEMTAYYSSKGITLYDALINMFAKYGYVLEGSKSITLEGIEGVRKIAGAMEYLRENDIASFGDYTVLRRRDYQNSITSDGQKIYLPKSNVIYYELSDGAWCCVRPSGTEPKIKFYVGVKTGSIADSEKAIEKVIDAMEDSIKHILY